MITVLNDSNFEEQISKGLKLVEFMAPWCGFCTKQRNVLDEFDKVWIGTVDTDMYPVLSQKYSINALPTFLVFKKGKIVEKFSGLHSKFEIMDILNKHII